MAFIGEGVVSFAVEKLWDLLSKESDRLQGIDDQLDGLKRQLRMLQSLLKDAETKKHGNETLRNFIQDVKDIVYDAEDIIESFLLKQFTGKEKGIKKHLRRLACFLTDRHKFALDIEGITKRISEVNGGMQSLGIQQIIDGGRSLSLQERQRKQREIREEYANKSESHLVGMEQSIEELVGQLVENDNIQLVSISGMGGIGKTTLARKVFHHDSVRRRFDGFAWVYVSQQFTQENVWQGILQELQPHDGEILKMNKSALQSKLFQLLKTGRYLVVLDDVWEKEDWDRMKAVFPSERGWKMLLTSRNEGVGLHADPTCFPFRPRTLTPEQSWKLCERNAFPRTDETELRLDEEMEAIGKKMVTYCGGLPLAVKVLGGLLAEQPTFPEWKRVYDNFGAQIAGNNLDSVNRILSLSYEYLPLHLKNCFLYLAHFPQDLYILKRTLFDYWAAEGIITSFYDGSNIRDSGEYYFGELVRRNMVIVEENYSSSRFEYFKMHDMMREVCLSKAKEENFVQMIKIPTMRMPRFPDQFRFPPHLAHIFLLNCKMEEDPMPVLEKLLHLKSVKLSSDAFIGGKMVCSKGGFPQLSALEIYNESELEEWIVEKGSMSCLRSLTIENCEKLKEIPDGIKYITSLKELKIEGMKKEWKKKLVPDGDDYYKVQHIPNVQFIYCDDE